MTTQLKDHQIAQLVNKLRDIAVEHHGHQCLRELISREVTQALAMTEPVQDVTPTSGNILVDAFNEVQALKQQATTEPDEDDDKWRDVALHFDKHRMQALWHLQAMLKDPEKHADIVRQFLKDPTHPAAATTERKGSRWRGVLATHVQRTRQMFSCLTSLRRAQSIWTSGVRSTHPRKCRKTRRDCKPWKKRLRMRKPRRRRISSSTTRLAKPRSADCRSL